jgi:hypothetical protein
MPAPITPTRFAPIPFAPIPFVPTGGITSLLQENDHSLLENPSRSRDFTITSGDLQGGCHDENQRPAILLLAATVASTSALALIVPGPGFGTPYAEGALPGAWRLGQCDRRSLTGSVSVIERPLRSQWIYPGPRGAEQSGKRAERQPDKGAQLHVPATNAASTPVTVGSLIPETLFTHSELYSTLFGLTGSSIPFSQIQSAEYTLFPNSLNPATNPIVNSSLYETSLIANPAFASNDPVIFHRKELIEGKRPFHSLRDPVIEQRFNEYFLDTFT